ncbi:MAG: hypothetical protein KBT36_15225 [Kurthia sp.]|nr:hypothetical protein [Candidatus Kurthia equi]
MINKSQLQFSRYEQRINLINCEEFKVEIGKETQLQSIQKNLRKYTHTRSTAKKLAEIIEDSNDDLKVLLVGDVHSNKSIFINELLNRQIMPIEYHGISLVNSIIRFGEIEGVTAHFFDGQVANFGLDQIELFAVSETFSSQIMREGLDHLDIVVNHELLKKITLFDTPSYRKSVFVKENFLSRIQAAVWVVNRPFRGLPSERALLTKLEQNNKELVFLVENSNESKPLIEETPFYNRFLKLSFSLEKLKQANELDDDALYDQCNLNELLSFFSEVRLSEEKFNEVIIKRFFEWVDRFICELTSITSRDPYAEAYGILKEFKDFHLDFIESFNEKKSEIIGLQQRLVDIKKTYQSLEIGHQLMKFLSENELDDQPSIKKLMKLQENYEQELRQYRRNHKTISEDQQYAFKSLRSIEEKLHAEFEKRKMEIFHSVQHKLIYIENKILEIQTQSEYKVVRLQRASKRLTAFNPVAEAKNQTFQLLNELNATEESNNLTVRLKNVNFDYQKLLDFYDENKSKLSIPQETTENTQSIYKDVLEKIQLSENN